MVNTLMYIVVLIMHAHSYYRDNANSYYRYHNRNGLFIVIIAQP